MLGPDTLPPPTARFTEVLAVKTTIETDEPHLRRGGAAANDGDDIIMVMPDDYNLSMLRKQLNQIGVSHHHHMNSEKRCGATSPSVHFATLTFVQPTTPPTSPQPKDLLRHHLKNRTKVDPTATNNCHVLFLDGMDVRGHGAAAPGDALRHIDRHHTAYREGLRKRKSTHLGDSDDDDDGIPPPLVMEEVEDDDDEVAKAENLKFQRSVQKLAAFERDAYNAFQQPEGGRIGGFAACS
ncbi:Aste57867_5606 [Aphanomyces stellatus]|uniref:Aste57867_5606 protein n=1 Tax=Aphanomyces stellatus TaxID=120398 RepID=A0A485KDM3_9STRA|nr:hypothetical protein As57867_005593 [Aphanomyces stellatus]VFT82652.1 Aste57867_5606 [Aphanomyces stellatus]